MGCEVSRSPSRNPRERDTAQTLFSGGRMRKRELNLADLLLVPLGAGRLYIRSGSRNEGVVQADEEEDSSRSSWETGGGFPRNQGSSSPVIFWSFPVTVMVTGNDHGVAGCVTQHGD